MGLIWAIQVYGCFTILYLWSGSGDSIGFVHMSCYNFSEYLKPLLVTGDIILRFFLFSDKNKGIIVMQQL